jgi:hypothetical protein
MYAGDTFQSITIQNIVVDGNFDSNLLEELNVVLEFGSRKVLNASLDNGVTKIGNDYVVDKVEEFAKTYRGTLNGYIEMTYNGVHQVLNLLTLELKDK